MIRAKRRPSPTPPAPLPILRSRPPRERTIPPRRRPSGLIIGPVGPQRYYFDARGQYRVFNTAEFQFFRSVNATFRDDLNGPAPDTYLKGNSAATNFGSATKLRIGWTATGGKLRAIFKFDLRVLPPGSTVTRARLLLNTSAAAATAVTGKARRLTQGAWVEGQATWLNFDAAGAWASPGGDYTTTDEVSWQIPDFPGDFEIAGLDVLVQDSIVSSSGLLHLILMRDLESGIDAEITVRSGEHATAGERPRLLVEVALPVESDTVFAQNATLPHEPSDEHIDGSWFFGEQLFNGVLPSGLSPLEASAERFARVEVKSGAAVARPPEPPQDVALVPAGGGVVQIVSRYWQSDANRATEWAVTYTTDGSEPAEPPHVAPTATQAMTTGGVQVLVYDLPAQSDGATVKVRLQTRRQVDSVWLYSEGSAVLTATADAAGGAAPPGGRGYAAP